MDPHRLHLRYRFAADAATLWPILADTERLNRRIGLPVTHPRSLGVEPIRLARVDAVLNGLKLQWDEPPFEWVEGRYYWVERRFRAGPLRAFNGGLRFEPAPGGTEVHVEAEFVPANRLGRELIRVLDVRTRRTWDRLAEDLRAHVAGQREAPYGPGVDLTPLERQRRYRARFTAVAGDLAGEPLGQRLIDYLTTAGESQLAAIRPFALARQWGVDRYALLTLCLRAVRAGVLDLSWDLVCPNCRGAKNRWSRLEDVRASSHCDDCQISFDASFDQLVEVTFRPNRECRPLDAAVFCSGGPRNTPHVVAQVVLQSGADRKLPVPLAPGRYRIRNLTGSLSAWLVASEGAAVAAMGAELGERMTLSPTEGCLASGEVALELSNRTGTRQQVIVERTVSLEESASAAHVSVFQEFRDLFSSQVLSPDTQLGIETLPLMFTDLKGSTELYRRLGDAAAYALVRDHFQLLREVVARHGGGVVKTIGDAVMAAFPTAKAAVACALEIHRDVSRFSETAPAPVVLKLGLHQGPCIAVGTDEQVRRLDYFGSTVNLAARTHAESRGGDLIVTEAILADAEVRELVAAVPREEFVADLRGIGATRLFRLMP